MSRPEILALPVERQRLSDGIYGHLLKDIMAGRFQVGQRLPPETQLAQQFGVSRPVVREALRRLQNDGVVLSRQGAGNYVQRSPSQRVADFTNEFTLHEVLQSLELRSSLEVLSARLAARNRSNDQLRQIEQAAQGVRAAMEGKQIAQDADYAFHRAIAVASGNVLLLGALDQLAGYFKSGMNVTHSLAREAPESRRTRALDEHAHIVHAIRISDPDSAAIAMSYHIDQSRNRLLDRQLDQ